MRRGRPPLGCGYPTFARDTLSNQASLLAGYNLGQNKVERQSPISSKAMMKARRSKKRAILASLKWEEGWPRLLIYFVQDCSLTRASFMKQYISSHNNAPSHLNYKKHRKKKRNQNKTKNAKMEQGYVNDDKRK